MIQRLILHRFVTFSVMLLVVASSFAIGLFLRQNSFARATHSTTENAPCPLISGGSRCYTPQQIRAAYDIQPLLDRGITGRGRTIVIISNGSGTHLESDLHLYDRLYGLPDARLQVLTPFGSPPSSTEDNGVSFDMEIAHSIAPDAALDVVLVDMNAAQTFNDQFTILVHAITYAVDHNLGDVISISTGFGEGCLSSSAIHLEHQAFQEARARHITILAEAGNDGNVVVTCKGSQIIPIKGVNLPAADPLVTAIGGTSLDVTAEGVYVGESAWGQTSFINHGVPTQNATGGGFSSIFPRPSYQDDVPGIGEFRGVPDVAFDADPRTGLPYVVNQQVLTDGSSAPPWAGIVALADQYAGHRLGFLNAALYRIAQNVSLYAQAFHDITTGNNSMTISGNGQTLVFPGYSAGPGWDAVSGWGTPRVAQLIPLLVGNCFANDGSTF